jgi:hypothetical protein
MCGRSEPGPNWGRHTGAMLLDDDTRARPRVFDLKRKCDEPTNWKHSENLEWHRCGSTIRFQLDRFRFRFRIPISGPWRNETKVTSRSKVRSLFQILYVQEHMST